MIVELPTDICSELKRRYLPRVLPNWIELDIESEDGARYVGSSGGAFSVIATFEQHVNVFGQFEVWYHVSVASPTRLPDWQLLRDMKDLFIGRDKYAYQVLPPQEKYVNIHPNCLHLYCRLDAVNSQVLPDFTQGGNTI